MTKGSTAKRRPLWRRIRFNSRRWFALHVLLYIAVGTWIWTLNAPTLDKRFDVLFWLALLSAHGLFLFSRRRIVFLFHLLMFAAGNGAIWSTTAPVEDKVKVTLGWALVAGLLGVWLFRQAVRQGVLAVKAPEQTPTDLEDDDNAFEEAVPPRQRARADGE